jgi:hypothetical protein
MKIDKLKKALLTAFYHVMLLSVVILLVGCQGAGKPRLRWGAFFGSPFGMKYTNAEHLGKHSYGFTLHETNGLVYTCKGGFIDIGHVREAADRTAYLRHVIYKNLVRSEKEFSFTVIDPSRYWMKISYPQNWDELSKEQREEIADDVSIHLGQYLAHRSLVWHEIITWYGFSTSGIFPDTISAFSWEDPYSDVVGTWLGVRALSDKDKKYDEAMTELIYDTLQELDVQPPHVAREAVRQIEGRWFSGGLYFFVHMKKRNLDVGLADNHITPWLVPGICKTAVPRVYPVPNEEVLGKYGFSIEVELEPRILEKHKIYRSIHLANKSRIKPEVDFPQIMHYIGEQENETVITAAAR